MQVSWSKAIALVLSPLLLGSAPVRASPPTQLDIGKLALEVHPEQCVDGSFARFFDDESNWPYLLAALNRCQRPEYYGEASIEDLKLYNVRLKDVITTIAKNLIQKLTKNTKTYHSIRPLWVSLMQFCQRIEILPTLEEWKNQIFAELPSDESIEGDGNLSCLLLDTVIILQTAFELWQAVIETLPNKHVRHQLLMAIYAQGKWVRTVQQREYLNTLFGTLDSLDDESVYILPAGFRKRFVKLLLELTVANMDRQSIIQEYFQINAGLWIQDLRSGDASTHPKIAEVVPMLPFGYKGEKDGSNVMEDYLQFIVTEYQGKYLVDTLKKVSYHAGEALCLAYKTPAMQQRMSVLASAFPPLSPSRGQKQSPQNSNATIVQEYMDEHCRKSYEVSLADPEIPVIGNVKYLRNNTPMDGDILFVDSILAKADASQGYIPDEPTKIKLDNHTLLAKLYLRLALRVRGVHAATTRKIEAPFNVIGLLRWIKETLAVSYATSTRSGAFRSLALAAVRDKRLGAEYLAVLCSPGKGDYCRNIYEASLRDALFSTIPSRMIEWKAAVDAFNATIVSISRGCDLGKLYACEQSIVTPNIGHVVAAIRHIEPSADQILAVKTISPWLPPTFLQNNYDPDLFSLLITTAFKGGNLQRIREYIQLAPATLVDTPGMMYATWVVTHVQAFPNQSLATPKQANILTNMLRDQRPTFADLCQDGRCALLTKEELAMTKNGCLLKELKTIISHHSVSGGEIQKVTFNITQPNQVEGTLADRMIWGLCMAYKEASGDTQKELFTNIISGYIKALAENLEFGDTANTLNNLTNIIADQRYWRETAANQIALLSGELQKRLKPVNRPDLPPRTGNSSTDFL